MLYASIPHPDASAGRGRTPTPPPAWSRRSADRPAAARFSPWTIVNCKVSTSNRQFESGELLGFVSFRASFGVVFSSFRVATTQIKGCHAL